MKDFTLNIYVADKRTKSGERLSFSYVYHDKNVKYMTEEVASLAWRLYPAPKFRIEFLERPDTELRFTKE